MASSSLTLTTSQALARAEAEIVTNSLNACDEQLFKVMDFLDVDKEMRTGQFLAPGGNERVQRKWHEVAIVVNKLGNAQKNGKGWKDAWDGLKGRAKRAYNSKKSYMAGTGGGVAPDLTRLGLTPLYIRALNLINPLSLEGNKEIPSPLQLQQQQASVNIAPPTQQEQGGPGAAASVSAFQLQHSQPSYIISGFQSEPQAHGSLQGGEHTSVSNTNKFQQYPALSLQNAVGPTNFLPTQQGMQAISSAPVALNTLQKQVQSTHNTLARGHHTGLTVNHPVNAAPVAGTSGFELQHSQPSYIISGFQSEPQAHGSLQGGEHISVSNPNKFQQYPALSLQNAVGPTNLLNTQQGMPASSSAPVALNTLQPQMQSFHTMPPTATGIGQHTGLMVPHTIHAAAVAGTSGFQFQPQVVQHGYQGMLQSSTTNQLQLQQMPHAMQETSRAAKNPDVCHAILSTPTGSNCTKQLHTPPFNASPAARKKLQLPGNVDQVSRRVEDLALNGPPMQRSDLEGLEENVQMFTATVSSAVDSMEKIKEEITNSLDSNTIAIRDLTTAVEKLTAATNKSEPTAEFTSAVENLTKYIGSLDVQALRACIEMFSDSVSALSKLS